MLIPVKDISRHIRDVLFITNNAKTEISHKILVKGYEVLGDSQYLRGTIIGLNDSLWDAEIKISLTALEGRILYDDRRPLDYYGQYAHLENQQSDEYATDWEQYEQDMRELESA